jgi:hypothetical protein
MRWSHDRVGRRLSRFLWRGRSRHLHKDHHPQPPLLRRRTLKRLPPLPRGRVLVTAESRYRSLHGLFRQSSRTSIVASCVNLRESVFVSKSRRSGEDICRFFHCARKNLWILAGFLNSRWSDPTRTINAAVRCGEVSAKERISSEGRAPTTLTSFRLR